MLEKLEAIKRKFDEVEQQLSDPKVIADMKLFTKLNREYKELGDIVAIYHQYRDVVGNIEFNKNILANEKDAELKEMAKADLVDLESKRAILEEQVRQLMVPKDPEDARNAVIELRAGTGGDEASIFTGDLYRMYTRYCERKGFNFPAQWDPKLGIHVT